MLKKVIEYVDYDGNERKETFYFNLTKAELIKLQMGELGGLQKLLEKIVEEQDNRKIFETFEKIVKMSYGEKSADGKRFIKNDELTEAFVQTEAYSNLVVELVSDPDAASTFINAIVPKEIAEKAAEAQIQKIE